MTETPRLFSEHNPKLQLALDSTSLGAYMFCPRFYQYNILEGYHGDSIDLGFGILIHKGKEVYHKALLAGKTWEQAQLEAVKAVFEASGTWEAIPCECGQTEPTMGWPCTHGICLWGRKDWTPWGGIYMDMWRCTGTEKYQNNKGNKAKCPYSHVGKWFEAPGPGTCGECGSATETVNRYLPFHKQKHRANLMRAIVWWAEDDKDSKWDCIKDPLTDLPAVELHFVLPLEKKNMYGESYWLCGYLDAVKSYTDEYYWTDSKSTKNTISNNYFSQFDSNIQMSTYDYASTRLFPTLDIAGGLIEGIQVTVDGARFGMHIVHRSAPLRQEYLVDLSHWINEMENSADMNYWPKNERQCYMCMFKSVCSSEPQHRQAMLDGNFEKRLWNPLEARE